MQHLPPRIASMPTAEMPAACLSEAIPQQIVGDDRNPKQNHLLAPVLTSISELATQIRGHRRLRPLEWRVQASRGELARLLA